MGLWDLWQNKRSVIKYTRRYNKEGASQIIKEMHHKVKYRWLRNVKQDLEELRLLVSGVCCSQKDENLKGNVEKCRPAAMQNKSNILEKQFMIDQGNKEALYCRILS